MHQQFGYFYYSKIVHFSNIIVNDKEIDKYSSNELIYGCQLDTFIIDNMEIYDAVRSSYSSKLFALYHTNVTKIRNVKVQTYSKSLIANEQIEFGIFSDGGNRCSIDLENITMKVYYSIHTMLFDNNHDCDISLKNVTLDNVLVERFWI